VFNGNGRAGSDNDRKKDYVLRLEGEFLDTILGTSYWYAPKTGGVTSNSNNSQHTRPLERYGLHFKYPAHVLFPGQDPAIGGEKYLIWGEALYGLAEATTLNNDTQKFWGGFIEGDLSLTSKLLSFVRFDYWEPDMGNKGSSNILGITPGVYITLWPGVSVLTLEYEFYQGGTQDKNDRLAAELQIFF
jgi:hypothetical protein